MYGIVYSWQNKKEKKKLLYYKKTNEKEIMTIFVLGCFIFMLYRDGINR